jgi:hypothetical protein
VCAACVQIGGAIKGAFDPANAGGPHTLDLADPYEASVAEELVALAWQEAGDNWTAVTVDNQPFELPGPEDGGHDGSPRRPVLPGSGILRLVYAASIGKQWWCCGRGQACMSRKWHRLFLSPLAEN